MIHLLLLVWLLVWLLLPSAAWAVTPAVTSTYNGAGTSGATATIASVACSGSDTLLLVFAGSLSEGTPTGITKGSTALTQLETHEWGGTAYNSIWYLKGASSASESVTATWGSSPSSGAAASAICLENVDQATTFGTPAETVISGTSVSTPTVSGDAGNDLIIGSLSFTSGGGATVSASGSTTKRAEQNPLGGWTIAAGTVPSGTTVAPTWTISSSQDATHIVVNVLGTAGGGGGAQNFFYLRRPQ